MPLPGSEVHIIDELPTGASSVETGTGFMVALAEKGPSDRSVELRSARQLTRVYGEAQNYTSLQRSANAFFSRGGDRLVVARVVGPGAAKATGDLSDGAGGDALTVTAANAGAWADSLTVDFTYSGSVVTATVKLSGTVVEASGDRDGKLGIIEWAENSEYIRITDGGGGNPDPGMVTLAGGDDDRSAVTDVHWVAALDLLYPSLGPGQVAIPGMITGDVHKGLLKHAAENNRFAVLDGDNVKATAITAAGVATGDGNGRFGTMIAPTVSGQPASPYVMGRIAYTDRTAGLGQYAAGATYGELGNVVADVEYDDSDRTELNEAGVQVIRNMLGSSRIYGFRTLAKKESPYTQAAHARVIMGLRAEMERVIEQYVLRKVDGRGLLFAQLEGALTAICLRYYNPPRSDLYGETAADAFVVDAGASVNTTDVLESGELRAAVAVRVSPGAERVILTITKAALADTLS